MFPWETWLCPEFHREVILVSTQGLTPPQPCRAVMFWEHGDNGNLDLDFIAESLVHLQRDDDGGECDTGCV